MTLVTLPSHSVAIVNNKLEIWSDTIKRRQVKDDKMLMSLKSNHSHVFGYMLMINMLFQSDYPSSFHKYYLVYNEPTLDVKVITSCPNHP